MVFEDGGLGGFGPLVLMRHASLLRLGTKTLLDAVTEKIPDATDVVLWGRGELGGVTAESTGKRYNEGADGGALFVNARARPTEALLSLASRRGDFVALAGEDIVAARLSSGGLRPGVVSKRDASRLSKGSDRLTLPADALFGGYWDLVESNGLAIAEQARRFEESLPVPRGAQVRGPLSNVMIDARADVEEQVTIDARLGPVVIDRGASVESFSRVMGPCYVGPKARVLSALVGGGTSIFDSCKVGGQVENSVILPYSNKAHHGYLGDSYLGSWVNIGAGCTVSNLKNTYGSVRVTLEGKRFDTGRVKLGPAIGDMAKLSIGSLVFAGKFVGAGAQVTGLAPSDVPSFTYYYSGKGVELKLESVAETQRRMMERRGLSLGRAEEGAIRKAFASTAATRRRAGVLKGEIGKGASPAGRKR